ncbi:hypothetical protein FCV25MIE_19823 [Fagus crenata]
MPMLWSFLPPHIHGKQHQNTRTASASTFESRFHWLPQPQLCNSNLIWSRIKKITCSQMHLKSPYDRTRTNQLVATLCYVSTHDLDLAMLALACQPDVRHQCLDNRSFKATSAITCLPASSDLSN